MTFDNELDRRDAARQRIVQECADVVDTIIRHNAVPGTPEERAYLFTVVMIELFCMMRQEFAVAIEEIME